MVDRFVVVGASNGVCSRATRPSDGWAPSAACIGLAVEGAIWNGTDDRGEARVVTVRGGLGEARDRVLAGHAP
jgi:hypothetical protein